ncbi:TetR family transcriptional regulator [Pseudonocardia ailaonensis]|uniref:TetR family transcriptional regulator n=1 Tax=Pseudonocardia ailaonensis TaxID=367279 RepID=A0ABN2NNL6_9PSEU
MNQSARRGQEQTEGIRSRARRAVRAETTEVAVDLFLRNGFDATTIEEIAAAAGMSRSTFFRYFGSKEDAVLGELADYGERVLAALCERPEDEQPWTSLRQALEPVLPLPADASPEVAAQAVRRSRLFIETPSLRARHFEKTLTWQGILRPEVARRLRCGTEDPRPAALIACVLACLDAALEAWTRCDGSVPLRELLDAAADAVGPRGRG